MLMKRCLLGIAVASGALLTLPAQATPVFYTLRAQSSVIGSAELIRHCRYGSGGWNCGRYRNHYSSYGKLRRWGSLRDRGEQSHYWTSPSRY